MYKEKVILLRGNHEPPEWLIPYPHDFPYHLRARYPGRWREFYNIFSRIFDNLPLSALCEDNVYFVHGGFSVKELDVDKYADPDREVLTELLWNDPMDEYGVRPSYRGVGYLFGSDITSKFLAENGLNIIVRGHEPCNGYWWRHNNKILTLFSRVGEPYYNRNASIAKMRLGSVISYRDVTIISMSRDDIPTL
jgi:protein phosphatase